MSTTSEIRHIPQQVRSAARRTQLLDVARELVREDGIDALTTGAIAARAGASIGTVYRYWSDVHAILDEILPGRRQTHDVLLERAAQVAAGYTAEHDDDHGVTELMVEADRQAMRYRWSSSAGSPERRLLVSAVAVALAALEVHDRENGTVLR